jgi:ADP-ribosylglycohydrolase
LGLAVGDALGAPLEFLSLEEILHRYGSDGPREFDAWGRFPPGSYTDDTQMSVATAVGLVRAFHRYAELGVWEPVATVHEEYLKWLATQRDPLQQRAPGRTCLSALESGEIGTVDHPLNASKGCGGVMRTAPVGLAFPADLAFRYGVDIAAITHGHPSGYLPAGFVAELVGRVAGGEDLLTSCRAACDTLALYEGHLETVVAVQQAMELAQSPSPSLDAVAQLGQGWVGGEALAIAVYSALRFAPDFAEAVRVAVTHAGDTDSTGSICGAILGTALGVEAIPAQWVGQVENANRLASLGNDLYRAFVRGRVVDQLTYPPG